MAGGQPPRDRAHADLDAALPAYEIGDILGSGAFAVVFAARHRRLEREVAIKLLSPSLIADQEARDRFGVEARLLASLDHPHIVRVYDYVDEESACALVMERMRGGTLGDRLKLGPLPAARSCAVVVAALHGLEHAHRQRILHRDVKPENLLFGAGNELKVADFGIAKMLGASGARLTATASRPGTPAFMAPEQASSAIGPLSTATDVWATGAVLHELLAGQPPFGDAHELAESLLRRVTSDPPQITEVDPDVPAELAEVVMLAIQRRPEDRYATAGEFAEALEEATERALGAGTIAASGIPIHRNAPLTSEPSRPTLVEESPIDVLAATRSSRRRRLALAGASLGLVAAAVVALLVLLGGSGKTSAASLPSLPPGWPKSMMLSYLDQVKGPAGTSRTLGQGGAYPGLFGGDAAAKEDWSQDPKSSPAAFVRSADRHGLFPYAYYYELRSVGRSGQADAEAPQMRRTLVNRRLMRIYWENVRKLLRSFGSTHRPAAVTIESGVFAELQQQLGFTGARPESVQAVVGSSGLPELRGLPDNLLGFAQAWRALRNRYAPKVLLGVELDDYGANVDISRDLPPEDTLDASARSVGEFYLNVAANDFDYAGFEVSFSEEGQNPSRTDIYSTREKEGLANFVREFVRVAGLPVVLDGVPLGNTASQAITDKPYHWRDSWVQWLVGDDAFTGLREMRDAGVIGINFGVSGGTDETCPCDAAGDGVTNGGPQGSPSTSADDDGGYLAGRIAAFDRAGALPLRP